MPASENSDKVWIAGGAAAALLVLVLGYFLLISPQNAETGTFRAQAAEEQQRAGALERHLAELRKQNAHLDEYKAELAAGKLALPAGPDTDAFLLELRTLAEARGVTILSMNAGTATKSRTGGTFTVPVTVEASGDTGKLTAFLSGIQDDGDRAALVTAASLSDEGQRGVSMTISLSLFVAPGVLKAAPTT